MQNMVPVQMERDTVWVEVPVTSAWGSAGALVSDTTDSTSVMLRSIGSFPIEYRVGSGDWTRLEYLKSIRLNISLASTALRLRKSEFGANTLVRLEINSLVNQFIADGSPVSIEGTGAQLDAVQTFTKAQTISVVALTPDVTVTPDSSASNNFSLAAAQSFTLVNATNPAAGRGMNIEIHQDSTGTRVITFDTEYLFFSGADKILSTAANAVDYLSCVRNAANTAWLCSLSKAAG